MSLNVVGNDEDEEGSAVNDDDDGSFHESDYDVTPEQIAEYAAAAAGARAKWYSDHPAAGAASSFDATRCALDVIGQLRALRCGHMTSR